MIDEEKIEKELQEAWDELMHRGIAQNEYTVGVNNIEKIVDIRTRLSDFDFNQKHRENREEREWFKATTDRLTAEAKMNDVEARVTTAKLDAESRKYDSEAKIEAAKIDANARIKDAEAKIESARIEAESRKYDADARVEAAKYECRTKAIGTGGNLLMTGIILLAVLGMDKEGNFPTKYLTILRGLKI
jgi:regulator of protease activity HflC (stomatin/prohibitin superfamily)